MKAKTNAMQLLPLILVLSLAGLGRSVAPPGAGRVLPVQGPPLVPGQLIASLAPEVDASDVAADHGLSIAGTIAAGRFVLLGGVPGEERRAAAGLNRDTRVEFAEPDWLRALHDSPSDAGYYLKWDLHNDTSLGGTADADIDWEEAYTLLGGSFDGSAVVAVIDTGIDSGQPDLDAKIVAGYDFYDNDPDPTDTYGHGTHVAGIALAETDNSVGTVGVGYSPAILVMPLRVGDEYGIPTSAVVNAIYHAADNGANVINMSLGGPFPSRAERKAVDYAWSKGLVIVASSGNDSASRVSYPAAFNNCIAVGSTNWHDQLAYYSNTGSALDVVAPGGEMDHYHDLGGIYSTMPTYDVYLTTAHAYSKGYDQLQGTSMAAPEVSGLAALLFAMNVPDENGNGRSNDEIRGIIESTADDLGVSGWDSTYGWGRINAYQAVMAAIGDNPPSVSIGDPAEGQIVEGTYRMLVSASDDSAVTLVELSIDGGVYSDITADFDGTYCFYDWDTTAHADGDHTLQARATDDAAQSTESAIVNVTVDNIDNPPSVSITNPTEGATVSGSVTVTADASDDKGVTQVEFFVDDTSIGTDTDGSNGWSTNWDTSTYTDGSQPTTTATATDTVGQTASDSVHVTVDNSGPATMHVGDLDGSSTNQGRTWTAMVTITIHDVSHNPVSNAAVYGTWSGGASGTDSATTNANGECVVSFAGIRKRNGSATFTVENVTHATLNYDSTANHDPDGDSDGTSITAYKP